MDSSKILFLFPLTCEINFTLKKELLLLSVSMAFAADAPGTEGIVKTLFSVVYTESSLIYKLKILSNEFHFLTTHSTLSLNYFCFDSLHKTD